MFRKIKHPNEYKTFKYKSITKTPPRTDQMTQSNQQNTKYRVQSIEIQSSRIFENLNQ